MCSWYQLIVVFLCRLYKRNARKPPLKPTPFQTVSPGGRYQTYHTLVAKFASISIYNPRQLRVTLASLQWYRTRFAQCMNQKNKIPPFIQAGEVQEKKGEGGGREKYICKREKELCILGSYRKDKFFTYSLAWSTCQSNRGLKAPLYGEKLSQARGSSSQPNQLERAFIWEKSAPFRPSQELAAHALIVSPWPSSPGLASQSVDKEKSWSG